MKEFEHKDSIEQHRHQGDEANFTLPFEDLQDFHKGIASHSGKSKAAQTSRMGDLVKLKKENRNELICTFTKSLQQLQKCDVRGEEMFKIEFKQQDGEIQFSDMTYQRLKEINFNPDAILNILRGLLAELCFYTLDSKSNIRTWLEPYKRQINHDLESNGESDRVKDNSIIIGVWQPLVDKIMEFIRDIFISPVENQDIKDKDVLGLQPSILVELVFNHFLIYVNANIEFLNKFNFISAPLIRFKNTLHSPPLDSEAYHRALNLVEILESWYVLDLEGRKIGIELLLKNEDIIKLGQDLNNVATKWMKDPTNAKSDDLKCLSSNIDGIQQAIQIKDVVTKYKDFSNKYCDKETRKLAVNINADNLVQVATDLFKLHELSLKYNKHRHGSCLSLEQRKILCDMTINFEQCLKSAKPRNDKVKKDVETAKGIVRTAKQTENFYIEGQRIKAIKTLTKKKRQLQGARFYVYNSEGENIIQKRIEHVNSVIRSINNAKTSTEICRIMDEFTTDDKLKPRFRRITLSFYSFLGIDISARTATNTQHIMSKINQHNKRPANVISLIIEEIDKQINRLRRDENGRGKWGRDARCRRKENHLETLLQEKITTLEALKAELNSIEDGQGMNMAYLQSGQEILARYGKGEQGKILSTLRPRKYKCGIFSYTSNESAPKDGGSATTMKEKLFSWQNKVDAELARYAQATNISP